MSIGTEIPLSIAAASLSVFSLVYSLYKVYRKKKAEDRATSLIIRKLKQSEKEMMLRKLSSDLSLVEVEEYRMKMEQLINGMEAHKKVLIAEGLNQPTEAGKVAYIIKLLEQAEPQALSGSRSQITINTSKCSQYKRLTGKRIRSPYNSGKAMYPRKGKK